MRIREIALDMGWLLVMVLLIPVAIPLFVLGFMFLLGQRLHLAFDRTRPSIATRGMGDDPRGGINITAGAWNHFRRAFRAEEARGSHP